MELNRLLKVDPETNTVDLDPHSLELEPIKKVVEEEDQPRKALAFIYFVKDVRSPYFDTNKDVREEKVKEAVFGNTNWEPTEATKEAMNFYEEVTRTAPMRMLDKANDALSKIEQYFEAFNPTETDENGKLKWKTKDLMRNMGRLDDVVESIRDLRKKVKKEQKSTGNVRGGLEQTEFNT